jgi:F0F1-type ATP synthase delta subunit
MEVNSLIQKVIDNTYTKNDIARRTRLLREYLEKTFFTPEMNELTKFLISRQATTDDIDTFLSWGEEFFKTFSQANIYAILSDIDERVKHAPVVVLYIPYDPVPAETIKLGKWFRRHVHDGILVDLHTDPSLLGGCAFVWKGMYRDYSLRYYMLKKREEIHKLIGEYVEKFYRPM